MAEQSKPRYTHEQDLGPGVVRTPGYEIEEPAHHGGFSDRRIDRDGNIEDHGTLSTYEGPVNPSVTSGMPATATPAPRASNTSAPAEKPKAD